MNTIFSNNLKKFRLQKNYTQEQVADILGVSTHTVSRWECNTTLPDVTILPEIAKLYCVSIDDLFKESSVAYENYAQRLTSIFESTRSPDDFIRADLEFKKLLKSDKLSMCDMWNYGLIHQFMANYCIEKAFFWYDKVLEQGKATDEYAYWKTRVQKMKLCSQLGKDEENIIQQRDNIEKHSSDVNEWCLMLAAYIFANRYEEAYKEFKYAISIFPNEWELYIHGGDICKKLKKYDEAFEHWDKAEELGTTFMDGKYSKAFCYQELEQYENAYNVWCEIAEELKLKGYDIEAEMPKKQAELCLEKLRH
ncbi:MAG: helix-turn-helix domain-containing protein [Eubacterium sp.]